MKHARLCRHVCSGLIAGLVAVLAGCATSAPPLPAETQAPSKDTKDPTVRR